MRSDPEGSARDLRADLARAREARARLRRRPLARTIDGLAAAAERWQTDGALRTGLPAAAGLSPAMVGSVLPLLAEPLAGDAMAALAERELGSGALGRPAPQGPALIAHVLASNVPGLALPAIALGCLAGAAVLVKSGRHDPLSAPAFRRALAAVDPELAATVVCAYWPGGSRPHEEVALEEADLVVLTGSEEALAALAGRVRGRLITHGPRTSIVALGRSALDDLQPLADAIALDVVLHEQRGCLSPHAVWVERGGSVDPRDVAVRLATALDALAERLPPVERSVEARAAVRLLREEAEWEADARVLAGPGGTVLYAESPVFRAGPGSRSVRVHPLASLRELPGLLPAGRIECAGLAGTDPAVLVDALRERGVARCCPPGRMQRPPLSWPRGQQAPLGALLGRPGPPRLEVEHG